MMVKSKVTNIWFYKHKTILFSFFKDFRGLIDEAPLIQLFPKDMNIVTGIMIPSSIPVLPGPIITCSS